jgi:hypothetical protein
MGTTLNCVSGFAGTVIGLEKLPPPQAEVLMIEARKTMRLASLILNINNLHFGTNYRIRRSRG